MGDKVYLVDAFTAQPFKGNPAAVVLLISEKSKDWMQKMATEFAVSETAFILSQGNNRYKIWWFTPTTEAPLCGHATLASAFILWSKFVNHKEETLYFDSCSGELTAKQSDPWIVLNFPSEPPMEISAIPEIISQEFGDTIQYVGINRLDYFVELRYEEDVINHQPNYEQLKKLERGIIITAKAEAQKYDFVSRVFAPSEGIPEDPVTGSAHCALSPYWQNYFKRTELLGYQASERGGYIKTLQIKDRTLLHGQAVIIMAGELI